MKKSQKCNSIPMNFKKIEKKPIFLKSLKSSHISKYRTEWLISLSYSNKKKGLKTGFWKMCFLAKNEPTQKKGGLQREFDVITNK